MKIVIIGSGNIGFHLGQRLFEVGEEVIQVFSRTKKKAALLAKTINADYCIDLKNLKVDADLYIIAVKDDAIFSIAKKITQIASKDKLVVHTSGGTETASMGEFTPRFGSFYPLQSFSIARSPNWQEIPICIDANNLKDRNSLLRLAKKISPKTYQVSDSQRATLHLAAVFVNNFSNHLFHIGSTILENNDLPYDLLTPLIKETVNKLEFGTPSQMQTGPAIRNDKKTIKTHLELLDQYPDFQNLYQALTASIKQTK